MYDLVIIIALILLNGVFSMSEVALISARKSKLAADAKSGSRNAATALKLQSEPDRFLSTVQIGITLIGILTGLFSGATIATELGNYLASSGIAPKLAMSLSKIVIVTIVTYLSIVVGELVPKRIGLGKADTIAKTVAGPMKLLSIITYPVVWLLSVSTSLLVKLLNIGNSSSTVTEEEIKSLIKEGTDAGEVREVEQDIMERALVMGDSRIDAIMTSRKDVAALTIGMDEENIRKVLATDLHSTYPVFDREKEEICGVVSLKQLILSLGSPGFNIEKELTSGLCMPDTMTFYDALETFKTSGEHTALVYDEYGNFQGIVTLRDILDGLIGNIVQGDEGPMIVKRPDKEEWLVDGQCPIYDFLEYFGCEDLYKPSTYTTIGGLILEEMKKVPVEGDLITWNCFRLEIADMDRARIDKVAVARTTPDA
ncbi:HlyC/CorC family transporter [Barnesiella sp. WM24]|uniref:hemolysin family protein n=1 Tax=Barnesiella sp. WM24 TaxID=2558278 RepID=UPI000AFF8EFD|nr:hemolysin family protein [Barnesiella sp. WM24]TFU92101.1 HlyC/CorC family transporter [Barnesiella sp. WM24]